MPLAARSATPSPQLLLSSPVALTCRVSSKWICGFALLDRENHWNILKHIETSFLHFSALFSPVFQIYNDSLILSVLAALALWHHMFLWLSRDRASAFLASASREMKLDEILYYETDWNQLKPTQGINRNHQFISIHAVSISIHQCYQLPYYCSLLCSFLSSSTFYLFYHLCFIHCHLYSSLFHCVDVWRGCFAERLSSIAKKRSFFQTILMI